MKNKIWLGLWMVFLLSVSVWAETETRLTVEYRGQAYVEGKLVPDGTLITIWANEGKTLMDTAVAGYGKGYFNHLEIRWDEPETLEDEGITYNDFTQEKIIFKIGEEKVQSPSFVAVTTADRGKTMTVELRAKEEVQMPKGSSSNIFLLVIFVMVGIIILMWHAAKSNKKRKDYKK